MIQGRNAAALQFQSAIHFKPALYFAEMQALIDTTAWWQVKPNGFNGIELEN